MGCMKRKNSRLVFCLVFLAATGIAPGQSVSSSVNGVLVDPTGAGVLGASCRLTNQSNGSVQTTSSVGDGRFVFTNVLMGNYTLDVQNAGFKSLQLTDIVVTATEIHSLGRLILNL